jgi:hypothetical protein
MPNPIPVCTFFSRTAMPNNLLTVTEWRRFAKSQDIRKSAIMHERGAQVYANRHGGAMILLADDTMVVFTKLAQGGMRRNEYEPSAWAWDSSA